MRESRIQHEGRTITITVSIGIAQLRPGEHHDRILRGHMACFRNEFGLSGVAKADVSQASLGNRSGNDASGFAFQGQPRPLSQRIEREMGACCAGVSGRVGRIVQPDNGQGIREDCGGFCRIADRLYGDSQPALAGGCLEQFSAANREKWTKAVRFAPDPCGADQFGPHAGGIAQRNR